MRATEQADHVQALSVRSVNTINFVSGIIRELVATDRIDIPMAISLFKSKMSACDCEACKASTTLYNAIISYLEFEQKRPDLGKLLHTLLSL